MKRLNRCLICIAVAVIVLSLLGGCSAYRKLMPPQDAIAGEDKNFDVLTRDGTIYHFDVARIDSLAINGQGYVFPSAAAETSLESSLVDGQDDLGLPFQGEVPMADVVLIQTHHREPLSALMAMAVSFAVFATVVDETGGQGGRATIKTPSGGGGSCPYIYAYDGTDYRLDAEPFVGAVARELEQTTWSVLPSLVARDGLATVAFCNQAPESQYLNGVRLLAIDHPAGSRLVAGGLGEVVAIHQADPPTVAHGFDGADVLALVAAGDDATWVTDEARIDPDRPATFVDGIVCEFPIPDGASSATIVLDVGNSNLGEFVTHKLLGEGGSTRLAWYRDLATDPRRPAMVSGAMLRMGGLVVEIKDGARWRQLTVVPVVGGVVPVERAVTTTLAAETDGTLSVRLRGAAGLWSIDAVAVDFEATSPSALVPLDMVTFRSTRPGATFDLLAEIDQNYLALFPEDWAVVQFAAPSVAPAGARSFVLEACGHYYPWVGSTWSDGPPASRDALPDGGEVYREWLEQRPDFSPPGPPSDLPRPSAGEVASIPSGRH